MLHCAMVILGGANTEKIYLTISIAAYFDKFELKAEKASTLVRK